MIWLTWRQQRFEMLILTGIVGILALTLLPTGLDMRHVFDTMGLATCARTNIYSVHCQNALETFRAHQHDIGTLLGWLNFLPVIAGGLLATPLVLDLETGTYRLAWTQSVPRVQWLVIKLTFILLAAAITGILIGALIGWWRVPVERLDPIGSFDPNSGFSFEGAMPAVYTVYGAALVLCLGTLLRRVFPAVVLSIVLFLVSRLSVQNFLRPNYGSPIRSTFPPDTLGQNPLANAPIHHGDWLLSNGFSTAAGKVLSEDYVMNSLCRPTFLAGAKGSQSLQAYVAQCLNAHHILSYVVYQPAGRFWLFQSIESALFLGLSAVLLAVTVWWVKYRVG